jgi:hypothetical protein
MDGQGTYHYSSGDIYTGGFRQGRKHGSGMYNFKAQACQFLGIWSDGEFVEGKWVSWVAVTVTELLCLRFAATALQHKAQLPAISLASGAMATLWRANG